MFDQGVIVDTAERMQVPLEFIAAPAIVAASSVVGRKIGIKPRRVDDWLIIPNLWGFLVADSRSDEITFNQCSLGTTGTTSK